MPIKILCLSLAFFSLAIYCEKIWISWMRLLKMGQAIKKYGPEAHMKKQGTPTMGGVVALFLAPFIVLAVNFCGIDSGRSLLKIWAYPVLAAAIGLLDDVLKYRSHSSEGLRSLQKLFLQILITVPWAYYISKGGIYLMPSWQLDAQVGIPLLIFLGVGIQNAVNVTDGLDGLATGAVSISLLVLLCVADRMSVTVSAAVALGVALAFLWHNANPAEVFMGDVGAHFWAGLLISLCIAERALLYIFPIAFLFGIEMISVTVQIVAIRKFKRKVFKMSPLHHHFELSGWGENRIVMRFWLIHLIGMSVLGIFIWIMDGRGLWNVG